MAIESNRWWWAEAEEGCVVGSGDVEHGLLQHPADAKRLVRLHRLAEDDELANVTGGALAHALHLKRDPDHADRWCTAWGTKTNIGLTRTVVRILLEDY